MDNAQFAIHPVTRRETENFIHTPTLRTQTPVCSHGIITNKWHLDRKKKHLSGFEMSLRVKSHTDLQTAGKSSLDDSLYKSLSMSSSNVNRGTRFGNGTAGEVTVLSRPSRRPVRAVRPVGTVGSNGSFLQINHLQGELVRKRKVRRERG